MFASVNGIKMMNDKEEVYIVRGEPIIIVIFIYLYFVCNLQHDILMIMMMHVHIYQYCIPHLLLNSFK